MQKIQIVCLIGVCGEGFSDFEFFKENFDFGDFKTAPHPKQVELLIENFDFGSEEPNPSPPSEFELLTEDMHIVETTLCTPEGYRLIYY